MSAIADALTVEAEVQGWTPALDVSASGTWWTAVRGSVKLVARIDPEVEEVTSLHRVTWGEAWPGADDPEVETLPTTAVSVRTALAS